PPEGHVIDRDETRSELCPPAEFRHRPYSISRGNLVFLALLELHFLHGLAAGQTRTGRLRHLGGIEYRLESDFALGFLRQDDALGLVREQEATIQEGVNSVILLLLVVVDQRMIVTLAAL